MNVPGQCNITREIMNMCGLIFPCQNHTLFQTKKAKSITLSQTKTAPKPYPLGRHIPMLIYRSTRGSERHEERLELRRSPHIKIHWLSCDSPNQSNERNRLKDGIFLKTVGRSTNIFFLPEGLHVTSSAIPFCSLFLSFFLLFFRLHPETRLIK